MGNSFTEPAVGACMPLKACAANKAPLEGKRKNANNPNTDKHFRTKEYRRLSLAISGQPFEHPFLQKH